MTPLAIVALYLCFGALLGAFIAFDEAENPREWWKMLLVWTLFGVPLVLLVAAIGCVLAVVDSVAAVRRWSVL